VKCVLFRHLLRISCAIKKQFVAELRVSSFVAYFLILGRIKQFVSEMRFVCSFVAYFLILSRVKRVVGEARFVSSFVVFLDFWKYACLVVCCVFLAR